MSGYFPIYLSFFNEQCLVVGGGKVAERKIKNILFTSPFITVVSPTITPYLKKLVSQEKIIWHQRDFSEGDIDGKFVVFAATDDEGLNIHIAELCKKQGILVNVVSPGKLGNFVVPSFLRKKGLSIAFSTEGDAPFFSALIKKDMQSRHTIYYRLFNILKPFRSHLLTKKGNKGYNKLIQKTFFNEKVFNLLEKGELMKVKSIAEKFFLSTQKD